MKNLAVGIDFSDADPELLAVAIPLAKKLDAVLHFVHVQREFAAWTEYSMIGLKQDPGQWEKLKARNVEALEDISAAAGDAGVKAEIVILEGRPEDQLLHFLKSEDIDTLIVGSHGRNRIERAVLGHVADRLVRKSSVPVLVVPMMAENG